MESKTEIPPLEGRLEIFNLKSPFADAIIPTPALVFGDMSDAARIEDVAHLTGLTFYTHTSNDDDSDTLYPGLHHVNRVAFVLLDVKGRWFEGEPFLEIKTEEGDEDYSTDPDEMSDEERASRTIRRL